MPDVWAVLTGEVLPAAAVCVLLYTWLHRDRVTARACAALTRLRNR